MKAKHYSNQRQMWENVHNKIAIALVLYLIGWCENF